MPYCSVCAALGCDAECVIGILMQVAAALEKSIAEHHASALENFMEKYSQGACIKDLQEIVQDMPRMAQHALKKRQLS